MAPLPTTPNPNAPGDRQAADNAARRAERRGDGGITAAEIRAALAGATDLADFQRRLADIGIEAEFQRRGSAAEIFGWKLRRSGADEWIKASTLAKDLGWPKISHRFQSDQKDEMQQQPERVPERPAIVLAPVPAEGLSPGAVPRASRAPAMLRGSLPGRQANLGPGWPGRALSARPEHEAKPLINLQRIQERELAPLEKSLLVLTGALLNTSAELIKKIMAWLGALLQKLGFRIAPKPIQQYEQSQPAAIAYSAAPAPLELGHEPRDDGVELATEAAMAVAEAVAQRDPELLPQGEGRAELIEAMTAEFSATGAGAGGAKDLQTTAAEFKEAAEALTSATANIRQEQYRGLPAYVDGRARAEEMLEEATSRLDETEKAFATWKAASPVKAALGADPKRFAQQIEEDKKAKAAARAAVDSEEKKHSAFIVLVNKARQKPLSAPLTAAREGAEARAKAVAQALLLQARAQVKALEAAPNVNFKLMDVRLKDFEHSFAAFAAMPHSSNMDFVSRLDETLRSIKMAEEAEQRRLNPVEWAEEKAQSNPNAPGR